MFIKISINSVHRHPGILSVPRSVCFPHRSPLAGLLQSVSEHAAAFTAVLPNTAATTSTEPEEAARICSGVYARACSLAPTCSPAVATCAAGAAVSSVPGQIPLCSVCGEAGRVPTAPQSRRAVPGKLRLAHTNKWEKDGWIQTQKLGASLCLGYVSMTNCSWARVILLSRRNTLLHARVGK